MDQSPDPRDIEVSGQDRRSGSIVHENSDIEEIKSVMCQGKINLQAACANSLVVHEMAPSCLLMV